MISRVRLVTGWAEVPGCGTGRVAHSDTGTGRPDGGASRGMAGDPPQFHRCWPHGRERFAPGVRHSFTVSQIHRFTEISENGLEVLCAVRVAKNFTVAQFHRETQKFGWGGGPETQILRSQIAGSLFPVEKGQEQRSVEEALESSSPQKGSGDPDWDRRVSFSTSDTSLRAGGVLDCKGGRGIRIVGHVRVPIWESGSTGDLF
jgi:hypothetical protein